MRQEAQVEDGLFPSTLAKEVTPGHVAQWLRRNILLYRLNHVVLMLCVCHTTSINGVARGVQVARPGGPSGANSIFFQFIWFIST